MALDKATLKGKLQALFDVDGAVDPTDDQDWADKVAQYVDEYLADVECGPYAGNSANPSGASGAEGGNLVPVPALTAPLFETALKAAAAAHQAGAERRAPG